MNTNTETTMSPAEILAVLDADIERQRIGVSAGRCDPDAMAEFEDARTAVAAMIEREAALVAERDSADRYGWIDGPPPYPHGEEWFLADTDFGPAILRSLPEENSYDYTTADHTHILKENVKRWMQLPESEFISYLSSGQILELRAERESLIADRDALAERVKALEDALRPLAEMAPHYPVSRVHGLRPSSGEIFVVESGKIGEASITVEHLRAAAALLALAEARNV